MTKKRKSNPLRFKESTIDAQIRDAEARGEFDNLPGAGKPIPGLDKPHDPLWWCKALLEREDLSLAPGALQLRKDLESTLEKIRATSSEARVRRLVEEINEKIRTVNASTTAGLASNVALLDPERIVAQWHAYRET